MAMLVFLALFPAACRNEKIISSIDYPYPRGYVNDYTHTISEEWMVRTEEFVQNVEKATSCEIAVAVIDNLQGYPIEEYANGLFNEWGIGKKELDNGVLLLVALEDQELRIEVGYGLESVITDLQAKEIIDKVIVPRFQNNNYESGIYNGVIALSNEIYRDLNMQQASFTDMVPVISPKSFFKSGIFHTLIIIISVLSPWLLGGLIIGILLLRKYLKNHRCPKCRRPGLRVRYRTLIRATYASSGKGEVEKTCKYCGYHEIKITTIPIIPMSSSPGINDSSSSDFTSSSSDSGNSGSSSHGFGGGSSGGGGASGGW